MPVQSDHGYPIGGVEALTATICLQRARRCLSAARLDPAARPYYASDMTHRDAAREWVRQARVYRGFESNGAR